MIGSFDFLGHVFGLFEHLHVLFRIVGEIGIAARDSTYAAIRDVFVPAFPC